MFKGYIGMVHYMQAIRADSRGAAGHLVTGRAAVVSQCCDMCLSVCRIGYLGTAHYTSPELIRVEPCGKPVDIWSLGVLLYILLGGQLPFCGTRERLFDSIVRGSYSVSSEQSSLRL